jgi:microcystin-dependent protein
VPFDIDVTTPQDNMLISAFPANERTNRQTIQDLIATDHYEGSGKHKIPRGTTAARPGSPEVGNLYYDTTIQTLIICLSAGVWTIPSGTTAPYIVGEIKLFGFMPNLLPTGWYACNAQALNRITHAALFAKIGVKYGPGDGSTTFNTPDLRTRTPSGANMTNVGNPATLSADGDGEYGDFGQVYGVKKRAITVGEMPTHNHPGSSVAAGTTPTAVVVSGSSEYANGSQGSTSSLSHSHGLTIANEGSSTPQDLRDPSLTFSFGIYSGV